MIEYKSDEVVEVKAIQWTGNNMDEVQEIIKTQSGVDGESFVMGDTVYLSVHEGMTTGKVGDYIVEHVTGDLFLCPKDEFSKNYELVQSKEEKNNA